MQEVNIYIDINFKGQLKQGKGTYSIVLEYIKKDVPHTREYIGAYQDTTKNRIALYACIKALDHLLRPCKVKLIINNKLVVQAVTQRWYTIWITSSKNAKGERPNNIDLWQQLSDRLNKHEVSIEYQLTNSYSTYMYFQTQKTEIVYLDDNTRLED